MSELLSRPGMLNRNSLQVFILGKSKVLLDALTSTQWLDCITPADCLYIKGCLLFLQCLESQESQKQNVNSVLGCLEN